MLRVAEAMYVIREEREAYLMRCLNPDREVREILWLHGIRNQYYFALNDLIIMTFEYVGEDFQRDMAEMAAFPNVREYMVRMRRRDVPADRLSAMNWWAPLKRLGGILTENPLKEEESELSAEEQYREMLSGYMSDEVPENDIAFSEDDWSESAYFQL